MAAYLDSPKDRLHAPAPTPPPRAALTTTTWSPRLRLTVGDWIRQGRCLGTLGRASAWWIGDWIRYGNARYGDRYGHAARVTGYDVQSLRNMAYVAGRFDPRRRRDRLSFSHHAELAGLPADEQDLWLDRAEASALSVRSLRSALRQTRKRAASRAALAEARRERAEAATSIRPMSASFGGELEAPGFANGSDARPTAADFGPGDDMCTAISDAAFELVCPECGCHFAPTAAY